MPHVAAGRPAGIGILVVTRATDPSKPFYQIVDEYYPAFAALMAEQGKELPGYVQRNLKNFSNAGGWSMAFYGFAASLATPSTGRFQL